MASKLILYNLEPSPSVRAVKTVAKLLGLELELRDIDLMSGEHLKEPFIKLNPEHTVPTLVDGDFVIWDSHAINAYLVDKYAKNDSLYPKDLQLRATCNQRLFFDASSLFGRLRDCSISIFFKGATEIPQEKVGQIYEAYEILEAFLVSSSFLVDKNLTIADISASITVDLLDLYAPLSADKHSNIIAWLERVRHTNPIYDEVNAAYKEYSREKIRTSLEKNKQKQ